jgi:hypothetical protein
VYRQLCVTVFNERKVDLEDKFQVKIEKFEIDGHLYRPNSPLQTAHHSNISYHNRTTELHSNQHTSLLQQSTFKHQRHHAPFPPNRRRKARHPTTEVRSRNVHPRRIPTPIRTLHPAQRVPPPSYSFFHPPHRADTKLTPSTRQYNNEARIINRKRCRGLRAAGYDYPPNGLIRLIDPLSGLACREAPFRLQHFNTLSIAELSLVGIFYGFNWNPNQAPLVMNPNQVPVVMNPGPWHTRLEMIEEYKAFIGANNH